MVKLSVSRKLRNGGAFFSSGGSEPWLAVDVWLVLLSFAPLLILALAYAYSSFYSLAASSL